MIKCSYRFDYYLIHVLNELLWACNNDCVMFVHYMSFDMRINNKYLLNWTEQILGVFIVMSGHGGLEVEQWSDNRLLSTSAVWIPLGTYKYDGEIVTKK